MDLSGMDMSASAILSSLIVSTIGFALFRYGKKEQRWPQLFGGMVLMVGPYFTGGALATWGFGGLVGAAVYGAVQLGW